MQLTDSTEKSQDHNVPESVETAVESLILGDAEDAADFLIKNPSDAGEFCLLMTDRYSPNDPHTPALQMSLVIQELVTRVEPKEKAS